MKKLILTTTVTILLFSCGSDSEKADNITMEHLYAYLYNNGISELQMYRWDDTTSVFSNDAYIINQLDVDGFFTGADDYQTMLSSLFDSLHYDYGNIGKGDFKKAIDLITKKADHNYGFFKVKKVREEEIGEGQYFQARPIETVFNDKLYYSGQIANLIKEFNKKIHEGTLTEADTLIEEYGDEVEYGEEGERIGVLQIHRGGGGSKKETVEVIGADGYKYKEEVDMFYSGVPMTQSTLVGCYNDGDGIYIIDDIQHVKENNTAQFFNGGRTTVVKPRIRKFDTNGLQQWTYCTMPCKLDSNSEMYNDLIYYSMSVVEGKLYIILVEEKSNIEYSRGNLGSDTNPFEYSKVLVIVDAKNGELISMERISNDVYSNVYKLIKEQGGVFNDITYNSPRLKFSKDNLGEKFETLKDIRTTNVNSDGFRIEIMIGKNIAKGRFYYFRYIDKEGNSGFNYFSIPYDYEDCNCDI